MYYILSILQTKRTLNGSVVRHEKYISSVILTFSNSSNDITLLIVPQRVGMEENLYFFCELR